MKDPSLAVDPTLTIEYQKLFTAASRYREVFAFRASSSHNAAMLMCIACPLSNTRLLRTHSSILIILLISCSPQTLYCRVLDSIVKQECQLETRMTAFI